VVLLSYKKGNGWEGTGSSGVGVGAGIGVGMGVRVAEFCPKNFYNVWSPDLWQTSNSLVTADWTTLCFTGFWNRAWFLWIFKTVKISSCIEIAHWPTRAQCSNLTTEGLVQIGLSCKSLERINVEGCYQFPWSYLNTLYWYQPISLIKQKALVWTSVNKNTENYLILSRSRLKICDFGWWVSSKMPTIVLKGSPSLDRHTSLDELLDAIKRLKHVADQTNKPKDELDLYQNWNKGLNALKKAAKRRDG